MSLMGAFYTGVSGINASQNALNATAHNISNIDTDGFTRQQVYQGNKIYLTIGKSYNNSSQVGLGVNIDEVRYVRDYFLDKAYRSESGRSSYYSTSYEAIEEINTLFGELNGTAFQESLQKLKNAFTSLAISPADSTLQSQVITTASQFLKRAQAIYNGLSDYQDNLNEQIKDQVDQINDYASKIATLNEQIVKVEAGGIENANDLRDARNLILDELSALGRIEYSEDTFGYVSVKFEGVELVKENFVNVMEAQIAEGDESTGFYTVVWSTLDDEPVFNLNKDVSAEAGTDKGSLRALIDSRGKQRGTYADYQAYTNLTDRNSNTKSQTESENFADVSSSSVASTMAMFDHMCFGIISQINALLTHDDSYDEEGILADNLTSDDYSDIFDSSTHTTDGTYDALFVTLDSSETNFDGQSIIYTISNYVINDELLAQPSRLNNGFILEKDDASTDQLTADTLESIFNNTFSTLTPDTATELTFMNYYTGMVNSYAELGDIYSSVADSLEISVDSIESSRQSVIGVSESDELTKMIKFQNAYNASSRYFNVVNAMLENLLTQLT